VQGLYVAAWFAGMGCDCVPPFGLVISELLFDGRAQTVDITPFRPNWFAEAKFIKAEFEYADD
jgi:hypothetical protein